MDVHAGVHIHWVAFLALVIQSPPVLPSRASRYDKCAAICPLLDLGLATACLAWPIPYSGRFRQYGTLLENRPHSTTTHTVKPVAAAALASSQN